MLKIEFGPDGLVEITKTGLILFKVKDTPGGFITTITELEKIIKTFYLCIDDSIVINNEIFCDNKFIVHIEKGDEE